MGVTCEEAENYLNASKCRFCQCEIKVAYNHPNKAFRDCCGKKECVDEIKNCCDKIHPCGHVCKGAKDEKVCLPCLEEECIDKYNEFQKNPKLQLLAGQTSDDFCSICYTSGLGQQASVRLGCRHIFHVDCLMKILTTRWLSPRIVFSFSYCPTCKENKIDAPHVPKINNLMIEINKFEAEVKEKAVQRAKFENMMNDPPLKD